MKAQVKLGLDPLPIEQVVDFAKSVKTEMTKSATTFADPNPPLTALATAIAQCETDMAAFEAAKQALKQATQKKNDSFDALKAILNQLASYVDNIAAGRAEVILSAGMAVRGTSSGPKAVINGKAVVPVNFATSHGDLTGQVDGQWDPVAGAKFYVVQYAPASAPDNWQHGYNGTRSQCTIKNLTPGTVYRFRVGAIFAGYDEPQGWSGIEEHRAE